MPDVQCKRLLSVAPAHPDFPSSLTDDTIRDTIYRMFQQGTSTSVRTVKRAVISRGFIVSDRRVARLLRQARITSTSPNIAVLSGGPWQGRDSVSQKLLLTRREFGNQGSLIAVVSELLRTTEPRLVGRFYDRSTSVTSWYYEVYAKADTLSQSADEPTPAARENPFGTMVQDPRGDPPPVLDDVVIVKNAPVDNVALDSTIVCASLISTLWFYGQGSSTPLEVVRQRELERFLMLHF